ncbi:hypothetical protein DFH09DRAFT_380501 [Mycena vulgaris]|nr:hypothetical protein DFH09DRAFT_380501 [Mycena vulgaris]
MCASPSSGAPPQGLALLRGLVQPLRMTAGSKYHQLEVQPPARRRPSSLPHIRRAQQRPPLSMLLDCPILRVPTVPRHKSRATRGRTLTNTHLLGLSCAAHPSCPPSASARHTRRPPTRASSRSPVPDRALTIAPASSHSHTTLPRSLSRPRRIRPPHDEARGGGCQVLRISFYVPCRPVCAIPSQDHRSWPARRSGGRGRAPCAAHGRRGCMEEDGARVYWCAGAGRDYDDAGRSSCTCCGCSSVQTWDIALVSRERRSLYARWGYVARAWEGRREEGSEGGGRRSARGGREEGKGWTPYPAGGVGRR